MARNPLGDLGNNLGDYLREQRLGAKLSLRQLSDLAGISNPYLSQIERGVKRPSAEILQQIAKGLSISAETLYVQAGLLDPAEDHPEQRPTAREAIAADIRLTSRQRQTLIDIYDSFVGAGATSTSAPGPLDERPGVDEADGHEAPGTSPRRTPAPTGATTGARTKDARGAKTSKTSKASKASKATRTSRTTPTPARRKPSAGRAS